jgi:hypothetical protein
MDGVPDNQRYVGLVIGFAVTAIVGNWKTRVQLPGE